MFQTLLKPGLRFKLDNLVYTILNIQGDRGTIQVVNDNFNEVSYFTIKEVIEYLSSARLKFEVKGRNVKLESESDINTAYLFNDLESNPYKDIIIYRYKVIEPLLEKPHNTRTLKMVHERVLEINKLIDNPSKIIEMSGSEYYKKVSEATIYRWIRFYEEGCEDIRSLAPSYQRCGGKSKPRLNDKIQQFIEQSIKETFMQKQRVTIKEIYYHIISKIKEHNEVSDYKLNCPAYSTIAKMVSIIPQYDLVAYRYGKRSADINFSMVRNGVQVKYPLERVEIDSTLLDIILVDEEGDAIGRPYIVAAIDKFSRQIMGFSVGFGSVGGVEVMQCIYHILTDKSYIKKKYPEIVNEWTAFGLPKTLVIDNGLAFKNAQMIEAALELGFVLQQCPPHTPEWKGSIERFFGTTNREFIHQLPGTTRSNPQKLSEEENPSENACLRFSLFLKLLHKWVVDVYSQDLNRGAGGIPSKIWEKAIRENLVPLPNDISQIATFLGKVEFRVISRRGIELNHLRYNSEELNRLLRKFSVENAGAKERFKVKYNPLNLSEVFVYDHLIEQRWIRVLSSDPEYTENLTVWEHNEAIKRSLRDIGKVNLEALAEARMQIYNEIQSAITSAKRHNRRSGNKTLVEEIQMTEVNKKRFQNSLKDNISIVDMQVNNPGDNNISDMGIMYMDNEIDASIIAPLEKIKKTVKKSSKTLGKKGKEKDASSTKLQANTVVLQDEGIVNNVYEFSDKDLEGFNIIRRP